MDTKLTFAIHIQNIIDKCKKGINILRCLAGVEWGASRHSLRSIYCAYCVYWVRYIYRYIGI